MNVTKSSWSDVVKTPKPPTKEEQLLKEGQKIVKIVICQNPGGLGLTKLALDDINRIRRSRQEPTLIKDDTFYLSFRTDKDLIYVLEQRGTGAWGVNSSHIQTKAKVVTLIVDNHVNVHIQSDNIVETICLYDTQKNEAKYLNYQCVPFFKY